MPKVPSSSSSDEGSLEGHFTEGSTRDDNHISKRLRKSPQPSGDGEPSGDKLVGGSLSITLATDGRETWRKKTEFLLAVIGFAVDLGNVWRFPYICYQNGGGAFLIPYCVMLIFGGLPLFYMELALGQYYRSGCITIWRYICPALKGVGYAICIIDLYVGIHYNTVIGWAVYYLAESFQPELPWISCNNTWNTENCTQISELVHLDNETDSDLLTTPAKEYYERKVLETHKSNKMDNIGDLKWSLALCVLIVFVMVYFSLWKGVRSTGKAVWVTALAPYFVLFILLIRGITLDGAWDGIYYYVTPQWDMLLRSKVWIDAATQIFFSLGPGFGTLLALSSYNKFHNNCYRDAVITSTINCLTSFLAGFVIFSVLGYMAKVQNKHISKVGLEGPGLVFIVYPEAIATMPWSNFWSVIFFLMLITLGLDSTFGGLEAIITALCDEYPTVLGRNREAFVAVLIGFIYVCALPTCFQGGMYLVTFLNIYGVSLSILFVVFIEAAGVFWIYGVERFSHDIKKMIGQPPHPFWALCWKFISPVFIFAMFVFSLYTYEDLKTDEYEYPQWSIVLGWVLTCSSLACVPAYILYMFIKTPGSLSQRVRKMIRPQDVTDMIVYNPPPSYGTAV